jgi:general secretion pathway protein K
VTAGGRRYQVGVALITVLLIVFLATLAATSLASLQQFAIRRSTLLQHQQQAHLYALGAEQWAMAILRRDLKHDLEQGTPVDSLDEDWAVIQPVLPIEGGVISGRIQDLQGRFNLNNLLKTKPGSAPAPNQGQQSGQLNSQGDTFSDQNQKNAGKDAEGLQGSARGDNNAGETGQGPDTESKDKEADTQLSINKQQLQVLQRLLEILELDPAIADAIADWIDADQDPRPNGAEDSDYAERDPPYAAANRPLTSISELRLIKGIDLAAYNKLAPYVCALPPGTSLNVNTATPGILAALDKSRDLSRFTRAEGSPAEVYTTVTDFIKAYSLGGQGLTANINLSVNSHYFLIDVNVQVGEGRAVLHSVVQRSDNGDTRVLLRSFGNND